MLSLGMWAKEIVEDHLPERIFYGTLTFIWLEYVWEFYLTLRQRRIYKEAKEVPEELKDVLDADTYTKARLYALDKNTFKIAKDLYELALTTSIFVFGMYFRFWQYSGSILSHLHCDPSNELTRSIVFYLIMNTTNTLLTLPLSTYYTFVLEDAHGFSHHTGDFYLKETVKFYGVSQLITIPLIAAVIYAVRQLGRTFFVLTWLTVFLTSVFLATVYPSWVAPADETLKPLPDGDLKTQIKNIAARLDFPLAKIFVAERSNQTSHNKMCLFGLFEKRIVLSDSLLEDYVSDDDVASDEKNNGCSNDEVVALLAHKFCMDGNAVASFVVMQLNALFVCGVFGYAHEFAPLYRAFGFRDEQPVLVGLLIVSHFVYTPYSMLFACLANAMTRRFEFQADSFAKSLGKAKHLRGAITKMYKDNVEFPVYDALYSKWHLSRPPLLERIAALDETG